MRGGVGGKALGLYRMRGKEGQVVQGGLFWKGSEYK